MSGNDLILSILQELSNEAISKGKDRIVYTYRKAIASIKRHPQTIHNGTEAKALDGIGDFIAKQIDKKLQSRGIQTTTTSTSDRPEHINPLRSLTQDSQLLINITNRQSKAKAQKRSHSDTLSDRENDGPLAGLTKRNKVPKPYKPKPRSGAWAILLALYRNTCEDEFLEADQIKNLAEPLSTTSMWPDTSKKYSYSAWSSHTKLTEKGLMIKKIRPTRFCLTLEGRALADQLDRENRGVEDDPSIRLDDAVMENEVMSQEVLKFSSITFLGEVNQNEISSNYKDRSTMSSLSESSTTVSYTQSSQVSLTQSSETSLTQSSQVSESSLSSVDSHYYPTIPKPSAIRYCNVQDIMDDVEVDSIVNIKLAVDNREKKDNDHRFFYDAMISKGIDCDIRQLSVGDFLWIGTTSQGKEVVLDTIIERKKVSDLCSSIVSGRYSEQKWRLSHCGLPKIVYLVEGSVIAWQIQQCRVGNLSVDSVESAMITTHASDEFTILQTLKESATIDRIVYIHRALEEKWLNKTIFISPNLANAKYIKVRHQKQTQGYRDGYRISNADMLLFTFDQFQDNSAKTKVLPIRDTFGLQLMSCNRCSADAAAAIVNVYKTPKGLARAYMQAQTIEERQMLLKNIPISQKRKIGPQLSSIIYETFWGD